jgi:hypothetical protein
MRPLPMLIVVASVAAPGCERLNPDWCARPGRCPAGTRCDPGTNTCVSVREGGSDVPRALDLLREAQPPVEARTHDATPRDLAPGCVAGWICAGGAAARCREAGGGSPQRSCPLGGCSSGHCLIPAGAKACTTNPGCPQAPQLWVCTWLLDGSTPRQVCAPSVAGAEGAASCQSGLDCSSGLCTAGKRCFQACTVKLDCGALDCRDTTIDLEGQEQSVRSCL